MEQHPFEEHPFQRAFSAVTGAPVITEAYSPDTLPVVDYAFDSFANVTEAIIDHSVDLMPLVENYPLATSIVVGGPTVILGISYAIEKIRGKQKTSHSSEPDLG